MIDLRFRFDIDPEAKGRPRFSTRNGLPRAVTPIATRQFENALRILARSEYKGKPLDEPLEIWLTFAFRKPKRPKFPRHAVKPDLDNLVKAITDALEGILWVNDSRIHLLVAKKMYLDDGHGYISLNVRAGQ